MTKITPVSTLQRMQKRHLIERVQELERVGRSADTIESTYDDPEDVVDAINAVVPPEDRHVTADDTLRWVLPKLLTIAHSRRDVTMLNHDPQEQSDALLRSIERCRKLEGRVELLLNLLQENIDV